MLLDDHAIDHLATMLGEVDETYSSLWREQVADIRFENGELTSLTGFGSWEPRHSRLKGIVHHLLQEPYRRHGRGLPLFPLDERAGAEIAAAQNRNYNLDILRQVVTLAFLRQHVPEAVAGNEGFTVVIGDGFGTFSSLMLKRAPQARVVMINLPQVLLADVLYLRRCCPDVHVALVENEAQLQAAMADPSLRAIALCARHYDLLRAIPMGLAVNIVSMQEMDLPIIGGYFEAMRHSARPWPAFYCCNREEKALPNGTVTRFRDYPWQPDDRILVNELCAWNQDYYSTRPPFYRPYDGPIRHRLLRLAPPAR